jgi:hypothetical protein
MQLGAEKVDRLGRGLITWVEDFEKVSYLLEYLSERLPYLASLPGLYYRDEPNLLLLCTASLHALLHIAHISVIIDTAPPLVFLYPEIRGLCWETGVEKSPAAIRTPSKPLVIRLWPE